MSHFGSRIIVEGPARRKKSGADSRQQPIQERLNHRRIGFAEIAVSEIIASGGRAFMSELMLAATAERV